MPRRERYAALIRERVRLLASPEEGGDAILGVLERACPGTRLALETLRQPTRLYGHGLLDLLALSISTVLSGVAGVEKLAAPRRLLEEEPERVDLRIEDAGPRRGMLSVSQPQRIAVIRKLREDGGDPARPIRSSANGTPAKP